MEGDVEIIGSGTYTSSWTAASDSIFKNNLQPLQNISDLLSQVSVYSYEFDTTNYPQLNFATGEHYGIIAQELQTIVPSLVENKNTPVVIDSLGIITHPSVSFKAVNYIELIPLLIQAFKEQKEIVDSLTGQLMNIREQLNDPSLENTYKEANNGFVLLKNYDAIILNQNVPNPFAEQTEINYFIPESVINAKLIFYDQSGKILKEYEINHKGEGKLKVYGEDLSSGIYSYTLVIDGTSFDTKRMVKQ